MNEIPNLTETVLGVFLHDIGKLLQRAHTSGAALDPAVKARESMILPVWKGQYSHWHALWTEQFFESRWLPFPPGVNEGRVREAAVYHHNPDSPIAWLGAEADRLAAGMDRKQKDEETEAAGEARVRGQYSRTPLECPYHRVRLGLGDAPRTFMPVRELVPGEDLAPSGQPDTGRLPEDYAALWNGLRKALLALDQLHEPGLFCESLLSLSERFLSTVPSSTIDQPDVSLHDHSRAAAAIAAVLYSWHSADGSLLDTAAIKNRATAKFRFLAGDLSGIQTTLFRLANQNVGGLSKILRARSFLFGTLTDAAVLLTRRELGLPVFSILENAGGRFLLLVADTPGIGEQIETIRREIDAWMFSRYAGELALNLALSPSFGGKQLLRENFAAVRESAGLAVEEAKLRAFSTVLRSVQSDSEYAKGVCRACAVRPAVHIESREGRTIAHCAACHDEEQLGRDLPRVTHIAWRPAAMAHERGIDVFGGLRLEWHFEAPHSTTGCLSICQIARGREIAGPFAARWTSGYVPRLEAADLQDPRYRGLDQDEDPARPGDIKTFGHLAADALEPEGDGWRGERFLAVLKADVDRLGAIFSWGVTGASLGLVAGLSRMTDFFFSACLPEMLGHEPEFRSTYTVYAGGDDLLLIGPWRQTAVLATGLQAAFARWTGGNPNITISAALELMKPSHPVNRTVRMAEQRLDAAKETGRNRICAFDAIPMKWPDYEEQLESSGLLLGLLHDRLISQVLAYRVLYFAEERQRAEAPQSAVPGGALDLSAASWRARWGYQLARHLRQVKPEGKRAEVAGTLNKLLGLDTVLRKKGGSPLSPRPAVTVALYRHRTASERR